MSSQCDLSKIFSQYINSSENTICRLCLKTYDPTELEYIFNPFENITVAEYVINFTKILITRDDCFSKVVCKSCVGKLHDIEDFRRRIYNCNEYLNQLYTDYINSSEPVAFYDSNNDKKPNLQLLYDPCNDEIQNSVPNKDFAEIIIKEEEPSGNEDLQSIGEEGEEDTKIDIIDHVLVKTESHPETSQIDNEQIIIKSKRKRQRRDSNFRFPCNQCDKTYKAKVNRDNHMKTHSLREHYDCDTCKKRFLSRNSLMTHIKIHTENDAVKFKCKECDKEFTSIYTLEHHIETHSEILKYQCDICGVRFRSLDSFYGHKKRHLLKMKEQKCKICNKVIRSRYPTLFKEHMRKHTENFEKSCPTCGKILKSPQGYQVHLKIHNGDLEFKCDLCPKRYACKKALRQHKAAVHSSVERYQCKICEKMFTFRGAWRKHEQTHSKTGRNSCQICEAKFGFKSDLRKHMILAHGILEEANEKIRTTTESNRYSCKNCEEKFGLKNDLRKHMILTHGIISDSNSSR